MNEHNSDPVERKTDPQDLPSSNINTSSSTTPENIQPPIFVSPSQPEYMGEGYTIPGGASITIHGRSGPLPSAEELRQYNEIDPTFAARIMAMAEGEAAHRRKVECRCIDAQVNERQKQHLLEKRGQWMAFLLCLLFLGSSIWMTLSGHPTVGGIAIGTTLVSVVVVFITGRHLARNTEESTNA